MDQPEDGPRAVATAMTDNVGKAASLMVRTISVARALTKSLEDADRVQAEIMGIFDKALVAGLRKDEAEIRTKVAIIKAKHTKTP